MIGDRLLGYLRFAHTRLNKPIWLTEFNANPYRPPEVQLAFLKYVLPKLENTPYLERYNFFQPFSGNGNFLIKDCKKPGKAVTPLGAFYRDFASKRDLQEKVYPGRQEHVDGF